MLKIEAQEIAAAGGMLAAITSKSASYLYQLTKAAHKPVPSEIVDELDRIIVHVDPHLDEYFAELLFRACLPKEKWAVELYEQAVFSQTDDLGCKHLWPSAAVLGLGSTYSGGTTPLFLFDEHVSGQSKVADSCSQIVADKMLSIVPASISEMLREINFIDEYGGGHPQNLNNLIKALHEARFQFGSEDDGVQVRDVLSSEWKRAIVCACLVAVIYCLENQIDIKGYPEEKRKSLESSLDNYIVKSRHQNHARFAGAIQRLRSIYLDQALVFKNAVLRNRTGAMLDSEGNQIPQLLLLSRVCFACEKCWGIDFRDAIATHFWEVELQNHLSFGVVEDEIDKIVRAKTSKAATAVGTITFNFLPDMDVEFLDFRKQRRKKRTRLWIFTMAPNVGVTRAAQAIQHYTNEHNFGCGLILMKNSILGTSALFKGSSLPEEGWRRLVSLIRSKEEECWHVIDQSTGGIAPFIVNGNKAHQYVPRSALDNMTLMELAKKTLY